LLVVTPTVNVNVLPDRRRRVEEEGGEEWSKALGTN
jgi:hypothetical protein